MTFKIHEIENGAIAELIGESVQVNTIQDALDLIGNASYQEARNVVVFTHQLNPDFFELKTRLAGEILQKVVNYQMRMAIVGVFTDVKSESLKAFITESNRGNHVFFVGSPEQALERLGR